MFRNQRGLSGQELADLMKVSRQTVYRWEQGDRMPDILTLSRLVRVLGVRIEDLLGAQDPAERQSSQR
jgi:transcriptional regulator with XRE-family HTH domain